MEFKEGVRVQKSLVVDGKVQFRTGVIFTVTSEQTESKVKDWYSGGSKTVYNTELKSLVVKWDDGEEEDHLSRRWDLEPEDSPMEREFRIKAREVTALINAKLAEANKALDEAEKLSEEYGISFNSNISPLSQSYVASTADEKWPDVDSEFMNTITDSYGEYSGWQHSAVC